MDGGGSSFGTDLGRLEKLWNTPGIILWSIVFFGGFLLNGTLLLAFLKRPGLRTISNRFVMNLTVSNLLTCAVLNPLLMLDSPIKKSIPGICMAAESATAFVTTSSILSILLIAIDQYLAVVDPLRYRTRIDKLKCGILIITVWLLSLIFSLFAGLNPYPNSLWLMCNTNTINIIKNNNSNIKINSKLILNITDNKLNKIEETFKYIKNIKEPLITLNYGFIYSIIFGIFIYLIPFISVCWIYISIYSAAHKNSERTRRTGSRPILSSASFNDDYYPIRQDMSNDDFRKITKISSLSSIDESIEISTSQLPRRLSDHHNQPSPIQEEPSSIVIFTVGSQDVDVTKKKIINNINNNTKDNNNNINKNKIPISVLKAEFLEKKIDNNNTNNIDDYVKSRFNNNYPEQKRKSSYDLMNDELLKNNLMRLKLDKNININDNLTSDDDEDDNNNNNNNNNINFNQINNIDGEEKILKLTNNNNNEDDDDDDEDEDEDNDDDDDDDDDEIMKKFPDNINKIINNNVNININKKRCFNFSSNDDNYRKYSAGNIDTVGLFCGINNAPIVTITPPNKTELQRVPSTRSTSSYINSLKYRISNGSLFKYREETRAARVSSIVIVMILICWTPYVVVLILKNLSIKYNNIISHNIDIIAFSFFILITYISPLLFGYRSRRVKRELKKIFCFKNELSYKNNKSLMAKKVLKRRHSGNLCNNDVESQRYNLFNCVYGKNKWPKDKVHFVQVPDTALAVETCRSSFSSGASTQISTTSTDES